MIATIPSIKSPGDRVEHPTKLAWLESLSYVQRQRLRFFEARLLWEDQVNRQDVCSQFGVTANHFTREVRDYRHHFPNNVWYDVSARAYRPAKRFQAGIATGRPEEYLALLKTHTLNPSNALMAELGSVVECEILSEPQGRIDQKILRLLLAAIHSGHGCLIKYQSFSSATAKKRVIWPHALVWSGDRWHVRAYDSQREAYIDCALARITSATSKNAPLPDHAGEDIDWSETSVVDIIPNPELSISQKRVIANEYGMKKCPEGYVWSVTLRHCLIPYFLHRYRLDDTRHSTQSGHLISQRIIVHDHTIIEKHAFPTE